MAILFVMAGDDRGARRRSSLPLQGGPDLPGALVRREREGRERSRSSA